MIRIVAWLGVVMGPGGSLLATTLLPAALLPSLPTGVAAQSSLIDPGRLSIAPSAYHWTFSTPVRTDTLSVVEASQGSAPLSMSFTPIRNWRVEVSGAYTIGRVLARDPASGDEYSLVLRGLTDPRVRAVGRLAGDRLWITAGLNLPAGRTGLDDDEAAAIRVLGAPALRMPTPVLGRGTGFLIGPVVMSRWAGWAVGFGASYERRNSYTPLESTLAGAESTVVDLDPGEAVHLSLGLDRIVGQGKMSFVFAADLYGTDQVTLSAGSGGPVETEYQLGPALEARWGYRISTRGVRDLRFDLRARRRSEFSDGEGVRVAGSAGSYLDVGVAATFGGARSPGLVLEAAGSRDSGIGVDDTLATAAMTGATLLVGVELPLGRLRIFPHLRGGVSSIDTGPETVSGRLLGAGLVLRTSW